MNDFTVTKEQRLAIITFSRPPINMMSFEAAGELEQILRELSQDREISVVVLASGISGYFIAHAETEDIMRMERREPPVGDPASWDRANALLAQMPQLTVAAVDGQAWGGGMETALACSLIAASQKASFRLFEVSKGTVPGAGGTQRLPRKIGVSRALRMILSCEEVRGEQAFQMGLADVLIPDADFLEGLRSWLEPFLMQPVHSFLGAKDAIVRGMERSLEEGLQLEKTWSEKLISSPETKALGDKSME